jgi:hypothetical protein
MSISPPASALTIDATVQMTSDQWELAMNTSEAWRSRSATEKVDLSVGLIDADGNPQYVKQVKDGLIQEWELELTPNQLLTRLRGQDAAVYAIQTTLYISYITGGFAPPVTPPEALPPGLRPILGVTRRIILPGHWTASAVCKDLANRVGLDCSYQAPDFVLREDVEVNGPIIQAIQQIVAPLNSFEPYKVDVYVDGGRTLMIRQRQGLVEAPSPGGPEPGGLNTVTVDCATMSQLLVRRHFLDNIRVFRATGAIISCSELLTLDPFTEQYDEFDGTNHTRTTVSGRRRRCDGAEINSTKETYNLDTSEFMSRETTTNIWDPLELDSNCNIRNSPQDRGSQTIIETEDPDDHIVRHTDTVTVVKVYDTQGFIVSQETLTEHLTDGEMLPTKREVKRFFENGSKQYTDQTTIWTIDSDGKATIASSKSAPASGLRPGGPGRAPKSNDNLFPRAFKNAIIDNVPGAKDFTLNAPSFNQAMINTIYDQAVASSGCFEYEVQFTAINIPWLKKGQMFKITGLMYEDGVTPVNLPEFTVLDSRILHTESGSNPTSITQVKGVFWSKTYDD